MSKKMICILLTTMMVAAVLVATAFAADEPVTITYALWDSNQAALIRTVADEFEAETGIHVDIQVNGWSDYWTGLEAAATAGTLPDTFLMHSNNVYYYESNGQMMDLTDFIANSDLDMSKYPQSLNELYNLDGKQYGIPKDYDTIGLWYNKTMFDEAGVAYPDDTWTWDDLKTAAKALTKDDGSQYGILTPLHNQEGFYNFIYQNGGSVLNADKSGSDFADPKTVESMEYYVSFVREGLSPAVTGDAERAELFQNGKVAMAFFGSWNLSGFAANEFVANNCDVAVLPASNNGGRASIFNGLGTAMAPNCAHPEEAWKWIEYVSNEAGQKRLAELGVAISAYEGTADAWAGAFPMFDVKCYIDMLDYAVVRPYTKHTSVWEDKSYELLVDAYVNGADMQAACEAVAEMMDAAIAAE